MTWSCKLGDGDVGRDVLSLAVIFTARSRFKDGSHVFRLIVGVISVIKKLVPCSDSRKQHVE